MDQRRKRLDTARDERVYKKVLPYTVTDSNKGGAKAYNDLIEEASVAKRIATRQRAIEAWTTVQANREEPRYQQIKDQKEAYLLAREEARRVKPSIFTRVYNSILNFFLNINY